MQTWMWTVEDDHVITASRYAPVLSDYFYDWTVVYMGDNPDERDGSYESSQFFTPEDLITHIMIEEFESEDFTVRMHNQYPHMAGYMIECDACASCCHCEGDGTCVHCQENNP